MDRQEQAIKRLQHKCVSRNLDPDDEEKQKFQQRNFEKEAALLQLKNNTIRLYGKRELEIHAFAQLHNNLKSLDSSKSCSKTVVVKLGKNKN